MKKIIYVLVFLAIPLLSDAQRWKHERLYAYAGIGNNYFLGDLGGGAKDASHYFSLRDIDWALTRPVFQGGIRYKLLRDLCIKPTITYARLKADDAESQSLGRQSRNLHFRSNLWEVGAQLEYYFIKEKYLGRYTFSSYKGVNKLSAYVGLGGGAFYFNPKSETIRGAGDWTALQPMQNEGVSYSLFAGFMSISVGMKYNLNDKWAIGLDISNRYTTTDYIDDAHNAYSGIANGFDDRHLVIDYDNNVVTDQAGTPYPAGTLRRGDPNYNDAYLFTTITGYYKLKSVFSMPKY
jgi:outer membrane protein W